MMSLYRITFVMAVTCVLCACAASPEGIKAANYSSRPYQHLTCQQLADYRSMLNTRLGAAYSDEEDARAEDAVSEMTIGFGLGSASHKWTPWQIADLKGRIAAVWSVELADSCPRPVVTAAASAAASPQ